MFALIGSIILAAAGCGLWYYGDHLNNDLEAVLKDAMAGGDGEPGNLFIYIGIGLLVVGAIGILSWLYKKFIKK